MTNMFHNLYFSDKNVVYCLFHEEKEVEVHRQSKYFLRITQFLFLACIKVCLIQIILFIKKSSK